MKNLLKIALVALITVSFTACDSDGDSKACECAQDVLAASKKMKDDPSKMEEVMKEFQAIEERCKFMDDMSEGEQKDLKENCEAAKELDAMMGEGM